MEDRARPGDRRPEEDPDRPMGMEPDAAVDNLEEVRRAEQASHDRLPTVFRWLDSVIRTVMVVLLVVLVVAVGANVFSRFVLDNSLPASAELSRFLFVWVIFLGAALAHLHNEHIAVNLLVERLRPAVRRWVVLLQELIILAISVALLLSAVEVMAIDPGTSPLLDVPLSVVNFSVPFSAGLMAAVTVYRIAVALRSPEAKEVTS